MWFFLKEENGQLSGRRVAAFICLLFSIISGVVALSTRAVVWAAYIPCAGFLIAMLLLFFFTTWSDVSDAIAKIKNKVEA